MSELNESDFEEKMQQLHQAQALLNEMKDPINFQSSIGAIVATISVPTLQDAVLYARLNNIELEYKHIMYSFKYWIMHMFEIPNFYEILESNYNCTRNEIFEEEDFEEKDFEEKDFEEEDFEEKDFEEEDENGQEALIRATGSEDIDIAREKLAGILNNEELHIVETIRGQQTPDEILDEIGNNFEEVKTKWDTWVPTDCLQGLLKLIASRNSESICENLMETIQNPTE